MPTANEIAALVVDRCPNCGSRDFRITRAKVTWARCGFLWLNRESVLRVFYECPDCGGEQIGAPSMDSGPYVDLNSATIQMAIDAKHAHQKKFRDLLGLE
jgi:predicted RNA-binding Zn-ribbon protein involved in translation (DUF1610 family)